MKSKHVELANFVFCQILTNPILWCMVGLVSGTILHVYQLQYYVARGLESNVYMSEFVSDMFSNVVTLLFVVRFLFDGSKHRSLYFEALGLVAQIYISYLVVFDGFFTIGSPSDQQAGGSHHITAIHLLVQSQIACSVLTSWMILYEQYTTGSCLSTAVSQCNNAFLPVLLAHSFRFVYTDFDVFRVNVGQTMPIIHSWAMYSLKFYCVFEYLFYEIGEISGLYRKEWCVYKRWILLISLIIFIGFDMMYLIGGLAI
ncbi:hypothetical protein CAAN2_04S06656 [[Candida] anglica]